MSLKNWPWPLKACLGAKTGLLLNRAFTEQSEPGSRKNVAKLVHLPVEERNRVVGYLLNNRHRMRYGDYRKQGLLIGSGPIEAAHRTVLQVRMKRSGQRWVNPGCDNMIRLRVAYKSGKFDQVTDLLKTVQTKF